MASPERPVIFLACADSTEEGKTLPNLQQERVHIENFFQNLNALKVCEVISHAHASGQGFFDIVTNSSYRNRIQVIHFAGHADGSFLRFISPKGEEEKKSVEELCQDLQGMPALKLVFLNGCATREFVKGLLDAGVPAVLATYRKIKDDDALSFAQAFYEGMVLNAQSIHHAYIRAKRVLVEEHQAEEDLLGISPAKVVDGQVQIPTEVIYRKSKSRKRQHDARRAEREEERHEFSWKLWHKEDELEILKWAFLTRKNLRWDDELEQKVSQRNEQLKQEIEEQKQENKKLKEKLASMIEADNIRIAKQDKLTEEIEHIQAEISRKEEAKKDALIWKELMDELLKAEEDLRGTRDRSSGMEKLEAMEQLDAKTEEKKKMEARASYQKAIQTLTAVDKEIAPLAQRITDIEEELDKLSMAATHEILEQEFLNLNFQEQKKAYTAKKGGRKGCYLNLFHILGAEGYGVDLLIRVIREKWKWSFLREPIPQSYVLNFRGHVSEDKLPNKDNIWHKTYDILFSKKGHSNRSPSSGKDAQTVETEVCKKLYDLLKISPVVIRWEHVQEARRSQVLIDIVNEFWKKLESKFPKTPPKHRLLVFLLDREEEEEIKDLLDYKYRASTMDQLDEEDMKYLHSCKQRASKLSLPHDKVYNKIKYAAAHTSFYPLPLIGPVESEESRNWFEDLYKNPDDKLDLQITELFEIASENNFFVEDKPKPIESLIQDICEEFDFDSNTLLKHA
ncbi:MAG: CHAT domain-containing protein [Bacteroidota bacterium]